MSTNNTLLEALSKFEGVTLIHNEEDKLNKLAEEFDKIAKCVFNQGYFQTNKVRRIYPTVIEFYYHEEVPDGLKDPVMYHTSYRNVKNAYYPLGALNFHISGMDVTFENETKHYRASFLIREYEVYEIVNGQWIKKKEKAPETRSTYIYEDLLMNIPIDNGINIQWVSEESAIRYEFMKERRKNVASYHLEKDVKKNAMVYVKDEVSNGEKEVESFKYNGKIYKQCSRLWSYRRK